MEIRLRSANFYDDAAAALGDGKSITIVVEKERASLVYKAMELHNLYFNRRIQGVRSIFLWFRFGLLGIRTPMLWGILNKAELENRVITKKMNDGELFITIG
jgi:hypothetical protein